MGVRRNTKPIITQLPVEVGTIIVVFTDGLRHAGTLSGNGRYDPAAAFTRMIDEGVTDARTIADTLLAEAIEMDNGRPRDDISVLVTAVLPKIEDNKIRRMQVCLPL